MDIQVFENQTLKVKNKKSTIAVDPTKKVAKFDADAVLITGEGADSSRVNGFRVVIEGPGEYEVSGLKVSGIKSDSGVMFGLTSDNVSILIAKASSLEKMSADRIEDYHIALINADTDLNQQVLTAIEPRVVVLYGEKAKEGVKALGKEGVSSSSKVTLSEDKLPEEMDVFLLS
jgi:hypothetical protein